MLNNPAVAPIKAPITDVNTAIELMTLFLCFGVAPLLNKVMRNTIEIVRKIAGDRKVTVLTSVVTIINELIPAVVLKNPVNMEIIHEPTSK